MQIRLLIIVIVMKANLKLKLSLGRNEKCLVCVSGGANSLALA